MLLYAPEMLMGNRILRLPHMDPEKAIRVIFRDDDMSNIRATKISRFLIDRTIGYRIKHPLYIGGMLYLISFVKFRTDFPLSWFV